MEVNKQNPAKQQNHKQNKRLQIKSNLLTKKLFFLFLLDLSRKDDPINQLDPLSHLDDERDWSLRRYILRVNQSINQSID